MINKIQILVSKGTISPGGVGLFLPGTFGGGGTR